MANHEQLDILKQGVNAWNEWRQRYPDILPNLSNAMLPGASLNDIILTRADLNGIDLSGAILRGSDLRWSNLSNANLRNADLWDTDLSGVNMSKVDLSFANLGKAYLDKTDLKGARLNGTDFSGAYLWEANFYSANLKGAYFNEAYMEATIFAEVDLSKVKGLETVKHRGPSIIGIDTIYRSKGNIPEAFLKGAGVDDTFITYIHSLVGKAIEYYTCFISYSSKDYAFVERLYTDLQSKGVRCWFAPKDLEIGDKIRPSIEESIRLHDKLLLVLSENSIASNWVAFEVERALNKEPTGVPNVLYPIRLDDTVMTSQAGWAYDIKSTRHIGDFSNWKNHDDYQKAFSKLLRALKSETKNSNE